MQPGGSNINVPAGCPRPHPGQARILADPTRHQIVRCGRRYGKTKLGLIAAIQTLSGAGRKVGWFAPEYKYSAEAWRELCWRLKPAIATANTQSHLITLKNGASIEVWHLDNNPDAGRSRFYDLIIIDEAGLVPNMKRWFDLAARATLIDRRGRSLWLSTPNVLGPDFDDFFDKAAAGEPGWKAHTAETFDNPFLPAEELGEIMRLQEELPDWLWNQEYRAIPAPGAGTFFPRDLIKALRGRDACAPLLVGDIVSDDPDSVGSVERIIRTGDASRIRWVDDPAGPWKLWFPLEGDRPDTDRPWCAGVDLGAGVGAANSVFAFGDSETKRKLAEYATPGVTPERAAVACALAGIWFGGTVGGRALIQFEINGVGEVFSREMVRLAYGNLAKEVENPGDLQRKDPGLYGWRSSDQARQTLLSAYRGALKSNRFTNPSDIALAEALTFRYNKTGKLESIKQTVDPAEEIARVPHGDRVFADALLWDCFGRCPPAKVKAPVAPTGSPAARVEARHREAKRRSRSAF